MILQTSTQYSLILSSHRLGKKITRSIREERGPAVTDSAKGGKKRRLEAKGMPPAATRSSAQESRTSTVSTSSTRLSTNETDKYRNQLRQQHSLFLSLPVTSIFNADTQQKITPRQLKPKKHEEKIRGKKSKQQKQRNERHIQHQDKKKRIREVRKECILKWRVV